MSFLKDESVIACLILKYPKREGGDGIKKGQTFFRLNLIRADFEKIRNGGPDWDHYKLVFEGKQCCTEDPYLDCSGVYSPC